MASVATKARAELASEKDGRHFRSPSCGSTSTADSEGADDIVDLQSMTACKNISYPLPLQVRNTFVEVSVGRSPSLDSYVQIRQTQSAPASGFVDATAELPLADGTQDTASDAPLLSVMSKPCMHLPADLHVQNTFLTCTELRPPSLEGFYEERLVRSCPGSKISVSSGSRLCPTSGISIVTADGDDEALLSAMAAVRAAASSVAGPAYLKLAANGSGVVGFTRETAVPSAQSAVVLKLCDVLIEPEIGSLECPSAGSKGHRAGFCKPCAFAMKGCASGKDCNFCHLCESGEKKRRRKEKKQVIREVVRWRKSVTDSWRHMSAGSV